MTHPSVKQIQQSLAESKVWLQQIQQDLTESEARILMAEHPLTTSEATCCENMCADQAWRNLIQAAHTWACDHMDQFEKVQFETPWGTVYLTLSRQDAHPASFDGITPQGDPM